MKNKHYPFIILLVCAILPSCSKNSFIENGGNNLSEISVTGKADNIGATTATLFGWANIGAEFRAIIDVGIEISEDKSMDQSFSYYSRHIDSDNQYYVSVTDLKPHTEYYYRSYLEYLSSGIYEYGDIRTFSTKQTAPQFGEGKVQIQGVSVSLSFDICDDGGSAISDCCIYYSKDDLSKYTDGQLNSVDYINAEYKDGCVYASLTDLDEKSRYYAKAFVRNSIGQQYSDIVSFTTSSAKIEAVDLGLSVMWASCNVGTTIPEESGDYFAWGETETHYESHDQSGTFIWKSGYSDGYTEKTYKWCTVSNDGKSYYTKYCSESFFGAVDNKKVLDQSDDVAHTKWGSGWRMPTIAEYEELINNCTWIWTTQNGVNGYKVTSKKSGYTGNSIFFPAAGLLYFTELFQVGSAGQYWVSSLIPGNIPGNSLSGVILDIDSKNVNLHYYDRPTGLPVRPVLPRE